MNGRLFERIFRGRGFCWLAAMMAGLLAAGSAPAQSIRFPWSGYGRDAQHDCLSPINSQPLGRILWQTPVDLDPQYSGSELLIHYGTPLITRSNSVIVPVKTGASGGFNMVSLAGATCATNWVQSTDYVLPPHNWTPSFSGVLTPQNRLYYPGGGGTVYFRDSPDASSGPTGQIAFYGMANYTANTNAYLSNVFIDTPITSDRYGNIFFGFEVTGSNPLNLQGGLARIDASGTGSWVFATTVTGDAGINKVTQNCAPALSVDHKTVYVSVNSGDYGYGYLLALDSRMLTLQAKVLLKDVLNPGNDAVVPDDGTGSPTVGPDGDVYYGVLENPCCENHDRGWLLHFNGALTQAGIPGSFGWDDTASVVPASLVASYCGSSPYLLMTKYNNYADYFAGGNGVNKIAILDPRNSMVSPINGATVMQEVITIAGPTPDAQFTNSFPNAVHEWCINSAVVDPATKSVLANNEDGRLYRWDLTSNTLSQTMTLTSGLGEAYTPTLIGVDGTVYAINNAILFAVGH